MVAYVDSDWAAALLYAGGIIGFKTRYQDTIAHRSTEAEFVAACDAGKLILSFQSLLADLNLAQQDATIMFEDN